MEGPSTKLVVLKYVKIMKKTELSQTGGNKGDTTKCSVGCWNGSWTRKKDSGKQALFK